MQSSKFTQVVLPVIVAAILSFVVMYHFGYGSEKEGRYEDNDSVEYYDDDYMEDIQSNTEASKEEDATITIEYQSIKEFLVDYSKEDASKVTELTLNQVYNWGEDEEIYAENIPEDGTNRLLDLSLLSNFPHLRKLNIVGDIMSSYDDDEYKETNYYYSIDWQSLTSLKELTELNLKSMGIDGLKQLQNTSITAISFADCDFSGVDTKEYHYLEKIKKLGLLPYNTKLYTINLLDALQNVTELDLSGIEVGYIPWNRCKLPIKNLTSLSIGITGDNIVLCEQLLERTPNLTSLNIIYGNAYPKTKAYELQSVGKLIKLKQLTIVGNENEQISFQRMAYEDAEDSESNFFDSKIPQYHDYSYLKSLTNLTSLTMRHLEITDISFASGMKKLKDLDLSYNMISDISSLGALTQLQKLDLSFNGIRSIDVLATLSELKQLSLGNNLISSIEAVKNMSELQSFEVSSGYYIQGDQKYSYDKLYTHYISGADLRLTNYYELYKGYHPKSMKDIGSEDEYIAFVDSSSNFTDMMIGNEYSTDNTYVTLCQYGKDTIWGKNRNRIKDLTPLNELKELEFLDVSGNCITDLMPIEHLSKLKFLGCMDNQIKEIDSITRTNYPNLMYIYASQNDIRNGYKLMWWQNHTFAVVQYYMTPFYNDYYFNLKEMRQCPLHVELYGLNISALYRNAYTGME